VRTEEVGPERDFELVSTNPATISKLACMPIYDQKQSGDDQHNQNKEPDKTPGGNEDSEPYNRKSSRITTIKCESDTE
jgi:hypothetical protein